MPPHDYQVILRRLGPEEGTGFLATVAELPGCVSNGATIEEAQLNIEDAINRWIAHAQALGQPVPWPRPRLISSAGALPSVPPGAAPTPPDS